MGWSQYIGRSFISDKSSKRRFVQYILPRKPYFRLSDTEILKYSLPGRIFAEILFKQGTGFQSYQVHSKYKDILLSEPEVKELSAFNILLKT